MKQSLLFCPPATHWSSVPARKSYEKCAGPAGAAAFAGAEDATLTEMAPLSLSGTIGFHDSFDCA
jgi:hypothetical protein